MQKCQLPAGEAEAGIPVLRDPEVSVSFPVMGPSVSALRTASQTQAGPGRSRHIVPLGGCEDG